MNQRAIAWTTCVLLFPGVLLAQGVSPPRTLPKTEARPLRKPQSGWKSNNRLVAGEEEEPLEAEAEAPRARTAEAPARARSRNSAPRESSAPRKPSAADDEGEERAAPAKPRKPIAPVTSGKGQLPAGDGQIWREYDISGYSARVTNTNHPEQAIIDWVLRETGFELWHAQPVGLLFATPDTLTCYHDADTQNIVADIVDRYVNPDAAEHNFSVRVVTVENPNWRARAQKVLQSVPVETQGVQAWMLHSEDAAMLLGELRRRNDFRMHSAPNLTVTNGQSSVVTATRTKTYIRDVAIRPVGWPGYETELGQIDEGFSLEVSPLLSVDGDTVDVVLKCNVDQLERLRSVVLDVPTPIAPRQRTKIEVPQLSHCRVQERFRWPVNQVLLIGLGVVASPVPEAAPKPLGITLPQAVSGPPRAELLVMIESRGVTPAPSTATARQPSAGRARIQR